LLVAGGVAFAYEIDRIGADNLVFLGALALAVIAVIFLKEMSHPDVSVQPMLHKPDHPTRT
jgi:hypothetical protein